MLEGQKKNNRDDIQHCTFQPNTRAWKQEKPAPNPAQKTPNLKLSQKKDAGFIRSSREPLSSRSHY